jgi:hypothetical protein
MNEKLLKDKKDFEWIVEVLELKEYLDILLKEKFNEWFNIWKSLSKEIEVPDFLQ